MQLYKNLDELIKDNVEEIYKRSSWCYVERYKNKKFHQLGKDEIKVYIKSVLEKYNINRLESDVKRCYMPAIESWGIKQNVIYHGNEHWNHLYYYNKYLSFYDVYMFKPYMCKDYYWYVVDGDVYSSFLHYIFQIRDNLTNTVLYTSYIGAGSGANIYGRNECLELLKTHYKETKSENERIRNLIESKGF